MPQYAPSKFYIRDTYPSEDDYFKNNPNVAGMAAEDGRIILNKYSGRSEQELQSVAKNEAARIYMRRNKPLGLYLTPSQKEKMAGYSLNDEDILHTVLARIYSGDPSISESTPEQQQYVRDVLMREIATPERLR